MEKWLDVHGYEGMYQVSNLGRVRTVARLKLFGNAGMRWCKSSVMYQSFDRKGYKVIVLKKDGIRKSLKVHRLVAMAFLKPDPSRPFVNHRDGVKDNNVVSNLEWCDNSENMSHAYSMGLKKSKMGPENPLSQWIIVVRPDGICEAVKGQQTVSRKYKIHQSSISRVLSGESQTAKGYKFYNL